MNSIFIESKNEVQIFKRCFDLKLPLLLKGPTGCGKSQLVQCMAQKLNVPLVQVACNEDTSSSDLIGRFLIKGSETVWQDGPVTQAVRSGAILYLDEIAEARPDVITAIHPLTDHRRELYIDRINQNLKAPDSFMCVVSFNPGYQQSFKEMKNSTKQRFVHLVMDYLKPDQEVNLLHQFSQLPEKKCKELVHFANKLRSQKELSLKDPISTRSLLYASKLIQSDIPVREACYISIADVLSDDLEVSGAIRDLIDLSF